jgi:hypothetical protein
MNQGDQKTRTKQQIQEEIDSINQQLNFLKKSSEADKNLRIQELEVKVTELGTKLYNLQKFSDK